MTRLLDRLRADVRDALRGLRRSPAYAAAAILSLAVGIGATTAVFSLVNAMLLRLAPVGDPRSLVLLSRSDDPRGLGSSFPVPFLADVRDADSLAGAAARGGLAANAEPDGGGAAERVSGELVSGTFFELLGLRAQVGRLLAPDDDRVPGGHPVVVLSHGYWQRAFGGDPAVAGRTLRVNGQPLTIVGVTPEAFTGLDLGDAPAFYVPIAMQAEVMATASRLADVRESWVLIVGRLRPGRTHAAAEAELDARYQAFLARTGVQAANRRLRVLDASQGQPSLQRRFARPLALLSGLAGAVLLLVCLNLANLLLARTLGRRQELAVRLALGGSGGRLVGQALVEAGVIAVAGAALGVLVARWMAESLAAAALGGRAPLDVALDARVFVFVTLVTAAAAVACGLAPALLARRTRALMALTRQRHEVAGGRLTARRLLVAAQIALSLALVAGAGLFARTLANLRGLDAGIDAGRLLQLRVDPTLARLDAAGRGRFYDELIARLDALPGVEAAAAAAIPLLARSNWDGPVRLDTGATDVAVGSEKNAVSPDWFRTVGTRFAAGRAFTDADVRSGRKVAVVNEAFARRYFGGDALGRSIGGDPNGAADVTIVGVARDGRYVDLREDVTPMWYVPYAQLDVRGGSDTAERLRLGVTTVYVRAAGDPATLAADVTRTIAAVDRRVTVSAVRTVSDQIADLLVLERLLAGLGSAFAAIAVFLAALGLYGVTAYDTASRTREIGVRLALGATPRAIVAMVLRQTGVLVAAGVTIGLLLALAAAGQARALLFGLEPRDPAVIVASTAVVVLVTLVAAWLPARRAARRVDPATALQ